MAKKKPFTPILTDLSQLSKEQQDEYVLAACEFLGVPSELGLVGLSLMDTGDGARNMVLYVKKGATDIIRNNRKINVEKLEQTNGDGYVGWMATGKDATGRQEIAVGTVSIKGLTGRAVADAVMTAQTKSMRRMTIQFAGGGFLDETEITEKTSNLSNAAESLSQLAQPIQPVVVPSIAAGKDITDASKAVASTPTPEPLNSAVGAIGSSAAQAEEPRKKRKRKTVSLDNPESISVVQPSAAPVPPVAVQVTEQVPVEPQVAAPLVAEKPVPVTPEPKSQTVYQGTPPTQEQKDEFKKKVSDYINNILPKAGFLQSEKLGSRNDKMKLFAKAMFPSASMKTLAVEQQNHFLNFMETKIKEVGIEGLVKIINTQIGEETNV